ncbi:Mor transcription activator family protein [Massilia timonae]|uniref:Mor transcription activator family protein n=1 Tax=Massilia timonae TaxID=47229 RepID=UPI00289C3374|nr:Mor transcription activator family protein [Massilia timonae]
MQNENDIVGAFVSLVGATLGLGVFTPEKQRMVDTMLRTQWGGQEVYVKKNNVDPETRALEIKVKYNGRNRKELMIEYNISRSQFYRFIKGG